MHIKTKIYIGADHRGQDLANKIIDFLHEKEFFLNEHVFIQGPIVHKVDYPDRVPFVIQGVRAGGKGILICNTGVGMSIAANRFKKIYAALCHAPEQVELARRHNNADILILPGTLAPKIAEECIAIFLNTPFEREPHERRLDKIDHLATLC